MDAPIATNYWQDFLIKMHYVGPSTLKEDELASPIGYAVPQPETQLDPDANTFISRVCEALAPTHDLAPQYVAAASKIQDRIRKKLTDVFLGKLAFDKWFLEIRQSVNKSEREMYFIIVQSLSGLKSRDARAMRVQYMRELAKYQIPVA